MNANIQTADTQQTAEQPMTHQAIFSVLERLGHLFQTSPYALQERIEEEFGVDHINDIPRENITHAIMFVANLTYRENRHALAV